MISYLRIERFKCFEDQNITFGKLTLLAGNNGTGKSTVLQALLLLRQAFSLGTLKNNELPLNGELIKIGTAKDALFGGSQEDNIAFTLCFNSNTDQIFSWNFYYEKETPYQHFMKGAFRGGDLPPLGPFAPRFFYLTAERLGPRLTYPMAELPRIDMDVGIKGEYTAHCLAEFGSDPIPIPAMALSTNQSTVSRSLAHQTQLWMRRLVPGIAFNVEAISKADSVRLETKVYGEQTDYLRPTNMGFGICYVLPIVVAGLMSEPGTMLIVENPEAHLHPAGQSRIGEFLTLAASHGVQVVVETHSDHVLNGIRKSVKKKTIGNDDVHIHFFARGTDLGSNVVTKPRISVDGGIDTWPEGFFDQFEQDLEELF
jgi:predicted ATPase